MLAALIAGVFAVPPDSAGAHTDPHIRGVLSEADTLGRIVRALLPVDVSNRVSDEAIELAQSQELAQARTAWNDDSGFILQVNYQLRFRSRTDYLSTEPSHLGKLLLDMPANLGIDALGLYMTDSEAIEFERRLDLGDRIPAVMTALNEPDAVLEGTEPDYSSNFGGVWQDQMDRGAIVVALVDPSVVDDSKLAELLGGSENLRLVDVEFSWHEIEAFRDALVAAPRTAEVQADIRILMTSGGRQLDVVLPDPQLLTPSVLGAVPPDLVSLTQGEHVSPLLSPSSTHVESEQQPGLEIDFDPGGFCTWGVNGHTNTFNYLVTAGHCSEPPYENFSDYSYVLEVHQNDSFLLTPSVQYVFSIYGDPWDMKRVSTPQADSNCYHKVVSCGRYIRWRALHNYWEPNSDVVCASLGTTNSYECGFILQENFSTTVSGCEGNRWLQFDIPAIVGDSGAGVIGEVQLTASSIDAILSCGGPLYSIGNTAYDVKTQLQFDFNCASSAVTGRSPSNWGACPTIDR